MAKRFSLAVHRDIVQRCCRHFSSIKEILQDVENGALSVSDAASKIQKISIPAPDEALRSFANLDHSRTGRTGFPEAVFAEGKTAQQVAAILDDMALNVNNLVDTDGIDNVAGKAILATR